MTRSTKSETCFPLSRPAGGITETKETMAGSTLTGVKYNRQPKKVTGLAVPLREQYLELEISNWAPLIDRGVG